MRVMHLIGGGDVGGAKTHIISLTSRLSQHCTVRLVSMRPGQFAQDALAAGVDTVVLEYSTPGKDLRRLLGLIDDFQPDILHCHGGRANMMGAMVRKRRNIPVISTIHSDFRLDYLGNPLKQQTFGRINALCLRKMDYYTCVAQRTAKMMIDRGFTPSRVFSIYNGIDYLPPREKADRREYFARFGAVYEEGDVICGLAVRLTAVKDVPTLLRAAAQAIARCPKLRLLIGGDGEERQALEQQAQELGIAHRVTFAGWVTDVREFFSVLDINIICSISETFPLSILEGIQEGCATIVSDVGGMPDLIDHGQNGFIFQPRDDRALGEYLYTLASDDALRQQFSEALREKASRQFSLDNTCATQLEIYRQALARQARAGQRNGVVICGAYGKHNTGDDAILRAILQEMRSIDPDMDITVLSRAPRQTALDYGVDTCFTFHIPKMIRAMRHARLYINGGGSLIQDATSTRSLLFYLYTLRAARRAGCKVMMYGCGIGPVTQPRNKKFAAKVINRCVDVITLREDDSLQVINELGIQNPFIYTAADPALTLQPDPETDALFRAQGLNPDGRYLCICVRPWDGFAAMVPAIAAAADYAARQHGLQTVILPFETPRDVESGQAVADAMETPAVILPGGYSPEQTIGMISRMAGILSMRLHALIFAAGCGVPLAGITYDQKVTGFMRYLGADLYTDMEHADADTLRHLIDRMADTDRDTLRQNAQRLRELEEINVRHAKRLLKAEKKK